MFGFQSIELYDPESPSVDDDLCLELHQSSTCEVSSVRSCESSGNVTTEIKDAESQKFAGTEGTNAFSHCTTTVNDKQASLFDVVATDEPVKPLIVSKPAIKWMSTEKMPRSAEIECDDVQTVKDSTVMESLDVSPLDNKMSSTDLDHVQSLQNLQQQQQHCSDLDSSVNNRDTSAVCDGLGTENALGMSSVSELVAVKKSHACDQNSEYKNVDTDTLQSTHTSELDSTHHDSHTNNVPVVDIADPTELHDVSDQMTALSQPRTIKLSRIEDPLEPDELFQTPDPNYNSEHVNCPRIIRLDRDNDVESDISDPSEPTDTEPFDDDSHAVPPREIKLNRDDSKSLFDSFAFRNELNSSPMIKPRVIQLNALLAKACFDYSNTAFVSETNPIVDLSKGKTADEIEYCRDTPLSPTESVRSVSDSEPDHRRDHTSESPIRRIVMCEDRDCHRVTDVENMCLSLHDSNNGVKSDQSVNSHRYLSDGEIVDEEEEEEEEFGIFQIPASTPVSRKEKQDCEQHKNKSEKKRLHEGTVGDVGVQCDTGNKSEDWPDNSKGNKRQKMSNDVCSSEFLGSSAFDKDGDKSVNMPKPCHDKSKTSKLPLLREQRHKKRKEEQASRSPEKLLVGDHQSTKRRVVVLSNSADESKRKRRLERRFSPSVTVSYKTNPRFSKGPLAEITLNSDMLEFNKRALNKRKRTSKRHHKRRTHQNESHAHKHKVRHKKHKHRKHRSDAEGGFDDFEQRHDRNRSRSYDRIVEIIRTEEQQSSNARHLRSVVVHKNTLISARQRSSSSSSYDSHHSFDNLAAVDVCQNSDTRSRNVSGGHIHLSRLSYSGELEQDGRTTLLGECIKSKYGPDYDANCISRYLANLCSTTDDANDEVEILGISYPGERRKNNSVQTADSSESKDDGSGYEHREVATSLHQQPRLPVEGLTSAAGVESATVRTSRSNDLASNKMESKKVMVESKEVQTQVSLFAETRDSTTECNTYPDNSNSKSSGNHGKVDKELQVSDFDKREECINSSSSIVDGSGNTVSSFTEVVTGIESPESPVEEDSHVPRPVLLERMDVPKHTPESPQQDLSDFYITVPNRSASRLSVMKTIALERVEESADILPQVTSDTSSVVKNATEQLQLGLAAPRSTEISSMSNAGSEQRKYKADAAEQLSHKNVDSDIVHSNARNKEECPLSHRNTAVAAPAVHQLPPVVQHRPVQSQRAVPLRHVGPASTEKLTVTASAHSSIVRLPSTSAIQQLRNEAVAAVSSCAQLQQPLLFKSPLGNTGGIRSAASVSAGALSPVSPHFQHEHENKKKYSTEVSDTLSFFTLKSDRIPGICEDVEPDASHSDARFGTSLSSRQSGLLASIFPQTSGSLGVINVVVTTAAASVSKTVQQTVGPSVTTTSAATGSYMASDALHPSSSQSSSASVTYYNPQAALMPSVTASSGNLLVKQQIAPVLPLLSTIATHLFSVQQKTAAVPASSTTAASVTTSSVMPAATSRSSAVNVPALKYATTTVSSTDAVSAWITSLPETTTVEMPQPTSPPPPPQPPPPPPPPKPSVELDFDVDAVVSPRSDEIMSFSPPSSEHMMAVIKMKHTLGLSKKGKKESRKTANGLKKPKETVSLEILLALVV